MRFIIFHYYNIEVCPFLLKMLLHYSKKKVHAWSDGKPGSSFDFKKSGYLGRVFKNMYKFKTFFPSKIDIFIILIFHFVQPLSIMPPINLKFGTTKLVFNFFFFSTRLHYQVGKLINSKFGKMSKIAENWGKITTKTLLFLHFKPQTRI